MKDRLASLAVLALILTGCSATAGGDTDGTATSGTTSSAPVEEVQEAPAEPLDLTGEWKQTNSNSADSYQAATISGEQITINWVNDAESTTALYWAGTYVPPADGAQTYTWDSANDTTQTDSAMLASGDPTKTFTYENGVLKYELTAMGVTMTVEMSKQ